MLDWGAEISPEGTVLRFYQFERGVDLTALWLHIEWDVDRVAFIGDIWDPINHVYISPILDAAGVWAQVEAKAEKTARDWGYEGTTPFLTALSFESSTNPQYALEAATLAAWQTQLREIIDTTFADVASEVIPPRTANHWRALLVDAPAKPIYAAPEPV